MRNEDIRGALARGYCTERNSTKELDANLIEDMAVEIEKLFPAPIEGKGVDIDKFIERFKRTFPNIYLNYYGNHAEESIEHWLRKELETFSPKDHSEVVRELYDALDQCRGQWIHSVNKDKCLQALHRAREVL